ncbi:hypothetical protein QYE76_007836 [Lolium multiflorum]|uniref:F-box domain-containing protein n=1 Tax=Lolium multiflorum TaxID=4521 RepID=A0AAD8VAY6_LOLMU|nr:hypothetical protein QYE76_007836 [Lolium multiflorum]
MRYAGRASSTGTIGAFPRSLPWPSSALSPLATTTLAASSPILRALTGMVPFLTAAQAHRLEGAVRRDVARPGAVETRPDEVGGEAPTRGLPYGGLSADCLVAAVTAPLDASAACSLAMLPRSITIPALRRTASLSRWSAATWQSLPGLMKDTTSLALAGGPHLPVYNTVADPTPPPSPPLARPSAPPPSLPGPLSRKVPAETTPAPRSTECSPKPERSSCSLSPSGTDARHLFDGMPPKRCKHSAEATDDATGEDLLSALPDAILQVVLSSLPSDQTVRTCVLSRRWRHLWKSTPALRVTRGGGWSFMEWGACKVNNFVNQLLRRRDRVPLDECEISIPYEFLNEDKDELFQFVRRCMDSARRVTLQSSGS